MSISPTEPVAGLFTGGTPSAPADNTDKDTFLKLMVAQLKYQDPMNPTDSSEFLSQTAQFTALEQMTTVAEQGAQAVVLQLAFGATSMVGRSVTYVDATGAEVTGTVSSVRFADTGPVLDVDGTPISMNDIVTIHSSLPATATGPTGATGTPTDDPITGTDAATTPAAPSDG